MSPQTGIEKASRRLRVVGIGASICFALVVISMFYWTIFQGPAILERDDNPRLVQQQLNIRRGSILDKDGNVLAMTVGESGQLERVYAVPMSGPAVGYYSFRHGTSGVEDGLNSILQGDTENPWRTWLKNGLLHQEVQGRDIRLTIDGEWQRLAYELMAGEQGAVLLFSMPDHAIRAMVSNPGYDPNNLDEEFELLVEYDQAPLLNRVTHGQYQPGLSVEPFLIAGAIADGLIDMGGTVDNLSKSVTINDTEYSCQEKPTGGNSWDVVLEYRCPFPLTVLATLFGETGLLDAYDSFGFFEAPVLPLATETGDKESINSLTLAGIGQDQLTISPLQVGRALASLANDGELVNFELVSAIRDEQGSWQPWDTTSPITKTTVPADVAELILNTLPVNSGVFEHSVIVSSGPNETTTSWYLALAPASDPRFGAVVVVENSNGLDTAVSIGRDLLTTILRGD